MENANSYPLPSPLASRPVELELAASLPEEDALQLRLGNDIVTDNLEKADTRLKRMRGLLGRSGLAPDEGLWIDPCSSIHMFFMRFAIDAIFLDPDGYVVRVHEELKPWRMARGGKHAYSVLELPAGRASFFGIKPGQRLVIE